MLHRSCSLRFAVVAALLSLMVLAGQPAASSPLPMLSDNLKDISNWQELMPEPVFVKIMEESVKSLQEKTRSSTEFNLRAKLVANEAYSLITFAEILRRGNEGETAQRAILLAVTAKELAAAAKDKDYEAAKKHVATLANLRRVKETDLKPPSEPLHDLVPMHNLMEQVQAVNKEMVKYRRLREAELKARGKSDEVLRDAHRMAAYSVCITAHVPTKDIPEGKSQADWLKSTEDLRQATLEIAAAAKAKNQNNLRAAIAKMDAACTKCHDDFRVDVE